MVVIYSKNKDQQGKVANPARGQVFGLMYVWSSYIARIRPNRVRLSILLVSIFLSPFAPENLVSRDGFGKSCPASACSSSILRLNLVLTYGIPPEFRGGVHLFI